VDHICASHAECSAQLAPPNWRIIRVTAAGATNSSPPQLAPYTRGSTRRIVVRLSRVTAARTTNSRLASARPVRY
jgi:hypothetical protein